MRGYVLPELPYDYAALEPQYGARSLELHHSKHHAAYVDGANKALEGLEGLKSEDGDMSRFNQLADDLAFNVSGHVLHSIFWQNLSPDGGGAPEGELASAIDEQFGSFARCKAQLAQAVQKVRGSGWGALVWDGMTGRLLVEQVYDHQDNLLQWANPVLVIDAWEHAYYLEHQNRRADWVEAFFQMADWTDVAKRFDEARAARLPAMQHLVGQ